MKNNALIFLNRTVHNVYNGDIKIKFQIRESLTMTCSFYHMVTLLAEMRIRMIENIKGRQHH